MSTRERFAELVSGGDVPLAACCFAIAHHLGHPDTVEVGLDAVERLAEVVGEGLAEQGGAVDLDGIAAQLFGTLAFRGDRATYYDVRNSVLPEVLRRRVGIPITLAVVAIEVADHLGVTATGVGMPGHFLVGDGPRPTRWLDAFDGGVWLDRRGAEARFAAIHGPHATFDPAFLRPTPRPQIIARVLANLAAVHRATGDPTALVRTLELRAVIPGVGLGPRDRVELAEALVGVGRFEDAIDVLRELQGRIDPRRRPALEARLGQLRAMRN